MTNVLRDALEFPRKENEETYIFTWVMYSTPAVWDIHLLMLRIASHFDSVHSVHLLAHP